MQATKTDAMATKQMPPPDTDIDVRQSLVAERAIVQRVNRALAKRGMKLIKSKGSRQVAELGAWHIADERQGEIVAKNVNLTEIARQEGALASYEAILMTTQAEEPAKNFHPVIGYKNGEIVRAAGGLTHDQAMAAAQAMAANKEDVDFVGAGRDRD